VTKKIEDLTDERLDLLQHQFREGWDRDIEVNEGTIAESAMTYGVALVEAARELRRLRCELADLGSPTTVGDEYGGVVIARDILLEMGGAPCPHKKAADDAMKVIEDGCLESGGTLDEFNRLKGIENRLLKWIKTQAINAAMDRDPPDVHMQAPPAVDTHLGLLSLLIEIAGPEEGSASDHAFVMMINAENEMRGRMKEDPGLERAKSGIRHWAMVGLTSPGETQRVLEGIAGRWNQVPADSALAGLINRLRLILGMQER